MKDVTNILKAALPTIIGVAVGMLAYEQIKKLSSKVA